MTSTTATRLPSYADSLAAFHRAFEAELRTMIQSLPLAPSMKVIDVGCGDGFYLGLLAERLARPGKVVGFDYNHAFLETARRHVMSRDLACDVEFQAAELRALAEGPATYDLAWCAQSLYSLPEPVSSLKAIAAAVEPGGFVVVLENDTLHQLLLPWPTKLELVLRTAEFRALADESRRPEKFYVGRRLPAVMAEAGLEPLGVRTYCIDRMAPLGDDLTQFVQSYLGQLHDRSVQYLDDDAARQVARYLLPDGDYYLPREPHFALCWMNVLAWARKPL